MTKKSSPKKRVARTKPAATKATALAVPRAKRAIVDGSDTRFAEVIALIEAARRRAYQAVNTELVAHYWELGDYISRKIASAEWGDGVVEELAADLARRYPGVRGYGGGRRGLRSRDPRPDRRRRRMSSRSLRAVRLAR